MEINNIINKTLDKIGIGKIQPSQSIVDEALSFNVINLDTIPDTALTKFIVGLSQHLIYIKLELNKFKIRKIILERKIEVGVAMFVAKSKTIKGTKAEKRVLAMESSSELSEKDSALQELIVEVTLLDGIDKYLEFYINAMKYEISRREYELRCKVR